jgi:hypothetical protein
MSKRTVTLTPILSDELLRLLDELRVIVGSSPDAAKEVSHIRFSGSDIFQINGKPAAADGAGQVVLLLEPSDRLRETVSALRAFERGAGVVERNGHGNPLQGGVVGCGDCDSTAAGDSRPNPQELA